VVNTFVGALYIAIEELLLELIRQVLQLLKVQLILHNFDHLDHHNQEHLVHHYSMENSVVEGSNYHFNRESVDYKLASWPLVHLLLRDVKDFFFPNNHWEQNSNHEKVYTKYYDLWLTCTFYKPPPHHLVF